MTWAAIATVCACLGAVGLTGCAFIGALSFALSQLDRRHYVRGLHRIRQAPGQ